MKCNARNHRVRSSNPVCGGCGSKIDRIRIDLTRKAGLVYLIDPRRVASGGQRRCARVRGRRPPCRLAPAVPYATLFTRKL